MDRFRKRYLFFNQYITEKSQNKKVVILTHNHCLTYFAENKRDVKFEPNYLNTLVIHAHAENSS